MTDPAYGLGHPGGLIVTGGLGHAEPALAGAMAARITGAATITATLTADSTPSAAPGAARFGWIIPIPPRRRATTVVDLAATITGTATLTATAIADDTERVVADFNRLVLDLEGVLL